MGKSRVQVPQEAGIFIVLLVVFGALATLSRDFGTVGNALVLLLNGAVIGFLAIGQTSSS